MPHIHTGPGEHDPTVSAYIVRTDTSRPTLMMHKHKKLGKYMQFGGHIELKEDPWQAITHELREEAGYSIDQLILLQPPNRLEGLRDARLTPYPICLNTHGYGGPSDTTHFHDDICFGFVTDQNPGHPIGEGESAHIQLFTPEDLRALTVTEINENVRDIGIFALEVCLKSWEQVLASTIA